MNRNACAISERFSIRHLGPFWMVIVQDAPHAHRPEVPCYHTAGVYYSEAEALALVANLGRLGQ